MTAESSEKTGKSGCTVGGVIGKLSGSEQVLVAPDGPYALRLKGAVSMSDQDTDSVRTNQDYSKFLRKTPADSTLADIPQQVIERFWAKVKITPECWVWIASKRSKGYGAFGYTVNDKAIQDRAHRFSYRLHVGPIPEGLFVLHMCDNPACVNPAHLFLGTNLDNIKDMLAKGRHVPGGTYCKNSNDYRKGTDHHAAVLTAEIVKAIRSDRATGFYSYSALAAKYTITLGHAWRIVNRKAWSHVE